MIDLLYIVSLESLDICIFISDITADNNSFDNRLQNLLINKTNHIKVTDPIYQQNKS